MKNPKNHDVLPAMGYLSLQESGIRWAKQARSFRCRDDQDPVWHGIPRVMDNHVDIMIGGVDWQDHNANLEATLKRIEDPNLTLRNKCEFGKTTMALTKIQQDSRRREIEPLKSREELISFILKPL